MTPKSFIQGYAPPSTLNTEYPGLSFFQRLKATHRINYP